jgi:hypothetical protein
MIARPRMSANALEWFKVLKSHPTRDSMNV